MQTSLGKGRSKMGKTEILEFRRITLSIQGTMASTREYEILKKVNGMEAALYDGGWRFNKLVTRRSCRVGHGSWGQREYIELAGKLQQIGVSAWNGFNETDPDVLDGSSFSLEIELVDGSIITAHGSNAYPKNYREFTALLEEAVYGPKEH